MKRVLFVCTMNYCRSPTAEIIYKRHPELWVRSCGTDRAAIVPMNTPLLGWADIVICFEQEQKRKLLAQVGDLVPVHNINIPDEYNFMDETLERLIKRACDPLLVLP